jgi:hypothetical protein
MSRWVEKGQGGSPHYRRKGTWASFLLIENVVRDRGADCIVCGGTFTMGTSANDDSPKHGGGNGRLAMGSRW